MTTVSSIDQYISKFPKSRALFERANHTFARGVTHDGWFVSPFPIYIRKAGGSRKWDEDGYEYVDYIGGHGALMLGHAHPSLVSAVKKQIENGTHYGTCHELQVGWGERVKNLVPSAEIVEFTNSGTEANILAMRLARAYTGRNKIVKFRGHFGGFADHVMVGTTPPWDIPASKGILSSDVENTLVIPVNDNDALERALSGKDVALLMVEAAGAFSGVTGISPAFYKTMRDLTTQYGTLLHFDEVVTGFRYAPGGLQAVMGVTPDLTSLGKILTGGMPGAGAIVGRGDIMEMLQFKPSDDDWNRFGRVSHTGTFNGNPLCAAAGIATLDILADGRPQKQASELASILRERMQGVIDEKGLDGCAYGNASVFHLFFGECEMRTTCERGTCLNENKERSLSLGRSLAINMTLHGVHMTNRGYDAFVSACHNDADVDKTVEAFRHGVDTLIEEGLLTTI